MVNAKFSGEPSKISWDFGLWSDKTLLILKGNFNKNYRLPLKRLYGGRILENHEYSLLNEISFSRFLEQVDSKILATSPTNMEW